MEDHRHQQEWVVGLLGSFRLMRHGRTVQHFRATKEELVLALLALRPRSPWLRTDLAAMLWPAKSSSAARRQLSFTLHRLRMRLESLGLTDFVDAGGRTALYLSPHVGTDVQDFEHLTGRVATINDHGRRVLAINEALALYGGGLLPGFTYSWLEQDRTRLERIHGNLIRLRTESSDSPSLAALMEALPTSAWETPPHPEASKRSNPSQGRTPVDSTEPYPLLSGDYKRILSFVSEAEPRFTEPQAHRWYQRVDAEYPLIKAVITDATERERFGDALRVAVHLWRYWIERGKQAEGRAILDEILPYARHEASDLRAQALHASGLLAFFDGFPDLANRRLSDALDLWMQEGNVERSIQARSNLALLESRYGAHDVAAETLDRSLGALRILGDTFGILSRLLHAAQIHLQLRHAPEARTLLEERMDLAEHEGRATEVAQTHAYLATVDLMDGAVAAARDHARIADEFFTHIGDLRWASFTQRLLGRAAQNESRFEEARASYIESVRRATESRDPHEMAESLAYLAELLDLMGETEEAARHRQHEVALRRSIQPGDTVAARTANHRVVEVQSTSEEGGP